jgi:DNA-directed RNA polymerase specialized sigma24 family protein
VTLSHGVGADADAIEAVYRSRHSGFRNALATVTGSQESALDAVQEGFAIALAKRTQFRGGSLEAWVWRIALRCAIHGRRAGLRSEPNDSLDAIDPRLTAPERDPVLAEAIRCLPPRPFSYWIADLPDGAQPLRVEARAGGRVLASAPGRPGR